MPKRLGIVFVLTGAVLILSALLLFLNNSAEDAQAGKDAESVLLDVESIIADRKNSKDNDITPELNIEQGSEETDKYLGDFSGEDNADIEPTFETEPADITATEDETMVAIDVNGYSCIGVLTIPAIEVTLPVLEDWSYTKLKVAPCRQFGSPNTDDFVIAAHNYQNHFGRLSDLEIGDEVTFTDMDGNEFRYQLVKLVTLDPTAITDVRDSGNALVLYTCTYGGSNRIAAFFDWIAN